MKFWDFAVDNKVSIIVLELRYVLDISIVDSIGGFILSSI